MAMAMHDISFIALEGVRLLSDAGSADFALRM